MFLWVNRMCWIITEAIIYKELLERVVNQVISCSLLNVSMNSGCWSLSPHLTVLKILCSSLGIIFVVPHYCRPVLLQGRNMLSSLLKQVKVWIIIIIFCYVGKFFNMNKYVIFKRLKINILWKVGKVSDGQVISCTLLNVSINVACFWKFLLKN